ncbi:MAG: HlyD family efflux transporter periplasmic adaptor subunit [Planctomycetes bacterium]|nr:HlyD family efflux transporter periplasmic adaptor subunit [Planctomycetota bacterium]
MLRVGSWRIHAVALAGAVTAALAATLLVAQQRPATAPSAPATPPPAERVVIQRRPLSLIDPAQFRVSMQLAPGRLVDLVAVRDGRVREVRVKPGDEVREQAEVALLDATEEALLLDRARAHHKAAEVRLRRARSSGETDAIELAEAELAAAEADVKLAQVRLEQMVVRAPFAGSVFRVPAVAGAFVRAGDKLASVGEVSQLTVEIPIDRNAVPPDGQIEIRIEDENVRAKVESILPLGERFEPLRSILPSAASAAVSIENGGGRLQAGQTVYAPVVPRDPVVEIPTSALANQTDGGRKVQVVREDVVRDVPVRLLGQVGVDRVFVSGAFAEADELVLHASRELADGTRVRASAAGGAGEKAASGSRPAVLSQPSNRTPPPQTSRF